MYRPLQDIAALSDTFVKMLAVALTISKKISTLSLLLSIRQGQFLLPVQFQEGVCKAAWVARARWLMNSWRQQRLHVLNKGLSGPSPRPTEGVSNA